jgi:hypothetical protein
LPKQHSLPHTTELHEQTNVVTYVDNYRRYIKLVLVNIIIVNKIIKPTATGSACKRRRVLTGEAILAIE